MKKNYVYKWLFETANELESIADSNLGAKYKIMLLMTYIDIFSQVWDVFSLSSAKNQSERFRNWIDRFIMDSEFLDNTSDVGPLKAHEIYQIRNALLHFAALPKSDKPIFIAELSKSQLAEKNYDKPELKTSVVLSPQLLYPKFIRAFGNTLEFMGNQEFKDESKFNNFIDAMYSKLDKNCAMVMELNPFLNTPPSNQCGGKNGAKKALQLL